MEPISASSGQGAGYTMDRSHSHAYKNYNIWPHMYRLDLMTCFCLTECCYVMCKHFVVLTGNEGFV